jgi:hypothetical protein
MKHLINSFLSKMVLLSKRKHIFLFNDPKGTPCQNFSAYFYVDSHVTGMTNGACKGSGCGKLIKQK